MIDFVKVLTFVENFDMRLFLTILIFCFHFGVLGQTFLKPGSFVDGVPVRVTTFFNGASTQNVEFITLDNYRIAATSVYATGINHEREVFYSDTLSFKERIDTLGNYENRQHYYGHALAGNGVVVASGLSHRTVTPIKPVSICAGSSSLFSPSFGWSGSDGYRINWLFTPEGIEYNRFNPRYVGYASSKHPYAQRARITGVFNRFSGPDTFLDIYDLYPEETLPSHKIFDIQIPATFFINHVIESNRMLLVSGFVAEEATSFFKRPKAMLIDLEQQSWRELEMVSDEDNAEVKSGLVDENGRCFLILQETTISGELVSTKIVRFEESGLVIKKFAQGFVPRAIVKQTNHGILLGGEYGHFGLKTAALMEVDQYSGLTRMIGYADLGEVETRFKYYDETIFGGVILGTYDSLNGTPQGSFMTPMVQESLLSVGDEPIEQNLMFIAESKLHFLQPFSCQYRIVDATGRVQMTGKTSGSSLDLSELATGFYAISVWKEDENQTLKTVLTNH